MRPLQLMVASGVLGSFGTLCHVPGVRVYARKACEAQGSTESCYVPGVKATLSSLITTTPARTCVTRHQQGARPSPEAWNTSARWLHTMTKNGRLPASGRGHLWLLLQCRSYRQQT